MLNKFVVACAALSAVALLLAGCASGHSGGSTSQTTVSASADLSTYVTDTNCMVTSSDYQIPVMTGRFGNPTTTLGSFTFTVKFYDSSGNYLGESSKTYDVPANEEVGWTVGLDQWAPSGPNGTCDVSVTENAP